MKRWLALTIGIALISVDLVAQEDGSGLCYLAAPASVFDNGLLGLRNPANASFAHGPELRYYWRSDKGFSDGLLVAGLHGLGFAYGRAASPWGFVPIRSLWVAQGNSALAVGVGHLWRKEAPSRDASVWTGGLVARPTEWLSLGFSGQLPRRGQWERRTMDLGLRPLQDERLTLGVTYELVEDANWRSGRWSGAVVIRPLAGVYLAAGIEERRRIRIGAVLRLGGAGMTATSWLEEGNTVYGLRLARQLRHDLVSHLESDREMVKLDLRGRVDYLSYALFDRKTHRFLRLLQDLRACTSDPRVGVIALNLADVGVPREMAWEIRRELARCREGGKRVVVYVQDCDLTRYWLASIADVIVMDPNGTVFMPGYVLGRTYLKHTLEKLGLGYQELRFFKYKSAAETFSRDHFSEADREQLDAYLDDVYATVRKEVCEARGWRQTYFDSLVNRDAGFLAQDAIKVGLVDTLGRWSDVGKIVETRFGKQFRPVAMTKVRRRLATEDWGTPPRIAVVYALGPCDMDTGIRARYLARIFEQLAKRKDVKAIVFRVDSPGGLIVPSDLVAQAIRRCREKKSVIVSQGSVAGSGGYWISAWGDSIYASPFTITGSIGVIGGWVYDAGFGEKLGLASDFVKRGQHADLMHGVVLPGLNIVVPHRPLTETEIQMAREAFQKMYTSFVTLVSEARGLSEDSVRAIGEGRIYSGVDGKTLGLVDQLGGLMDALDAAKRACGIPPGRSVEILEYPKHRGLLELGLPMAGGRGQGSLVSQLRWYVQALTDRALRPLAIVPPGVLLLEARN